MALYEVILNIAYNAVQCINRFNYVSSGTPSAVLGSFGLASALGAIPDGGVYPEDTLISRISELLHEDASFVQITVNNVYDLDDFYQTPFVPGINGVIGGTGMTPANAYGFRTNKVTRAIRRGTKRFVGVSTGQTGDGGAVVVSPGSAMDNLAVQMGATVEYDDEGNTLTFVPAICSKELRNVPDSSPVRQAYYYYETLAEQIAHTATGFFWEPYGFIRTQSTRQYGRGS